MAKAKVEIDPIVQKAMEAHGDCAPFKVGAQLFVFRPLTLDEYEAITERSRKKDANQGAINRECCMVALVHPASVGELEKVFERQPGFATIASASIIGLSAADVEIVVKKG